jgi:hypothetical protein
MSHRALEQAETEVAKILLSSSMSRMIVQAVAKIDQRKVDLRMSKILKGFSKNIREFAMERIEKDTCDLLSTRAIAIATKMGQMSTVDMERPKPQWSAQLLEGINARYLGKDLSQQAVAKVEWFRAYDLGFAEELGDTSEEASRLDKPREEDIEDTYQDKSREENIEDTYQQDSESEHSEDEEVPEASQLIASKQELETSSKFLGSDKVQDLLLEAVKKRFFRPSQEKETTLNERVSGREVDSFTSERPVPETKQSLKEASLPTPSQCDIAKQELGTLSLLSLLSNEKQIPGSWPEEHVSNKSESIEFTPYELGCLDKARVMLEEKLNIDIFWWLCDPPIWLEPGTKLLKMTWTCVRSPIVQHFHLFLYLMPSSLAGIRPLALLTKLLLKDTEPFINVCHQEQEPLIRHKQPAQDNLNQQLQRLHVPPHPTLKGCPAATTIPPYRRSL